MTFQAGLTQKNLQGLQERRVGYYPAKKVVAAWVTAPHHHHEQHRYVYIIPEIRNDNEVWLKAAAANNDTSLMSISVHVLYHNADATQ